MPPTSESLTTLPAPLSTGDGGGGALAPAQVNSGSEDPDDFDGEIRRMPSAELKEAAKVFKERQSQANRVSTASDKTNEGPKERKLLGAHLFPKKVGGTNGAGQGEDDKGHNHKKKGAFSGVFVPTCENMWGVLIFLRFYTIVGQAGILQALAAVFLSFCCAFCTTSSMSAIVSSGGVVSRGGPYYMISRALGPCVGASVGIMYWLAITMLAVLEVLGAVEGILMVSDKAYFPGCARVYGLALMFCLTLFVWGGIALVSRLGIFFVFIVASTLIMFYVGLIMAPFTPQSPDFVSDNSYVTGLSTSTFSDNWGAHYTDGKNFGYVLSVFFPCFTGILSGANRADILKDPPKNLRQGTFGAIIFSLFMYSSYMILWGMVANYQYLQGNHWPPGEGPAGSASGSASLGDGRRLAGGATGVFVVDEIVWNPFPNAAKVGIIISSLSQALQCLVVSPRLLNAIAKDKILSFLDPLAPTSNGEPKRALGASAVVGCLLVLMGKLDLVAPLLSMCFLVAYAFMNFSCFVLTWLKSPAWRPKGIQRKRWRLWYMTTSGGGFFICLVIMFTIDHWWAIIACIIAVLLYVYVNYKIEAKGWGSAIDGIRFNLALNSLIQMEQHQHHAVNWRPQVLILYRIHLADELKGIKQHEILRLYSHMRKGNGFCVVACVLESDKRDEHAIHKARIEKEVIQTIMKEESIQGFAEVVVAPSWKEGTNYIIQLTGIGGLVPNTVLLDWPEKWKTSPLKAQEFIEVLQTALAADKAVLAVRGLREMPNDIVYGTIDIWWMIHDGGFLILLSWLLVQHRIWRKCHLRVFTITEGVNEAQAKAAAELLTETLKQRRLFDVDVEVILADDEMIEPYTHDWTLREEERHRFLQELNESRGGSGPQDEAIPLEIDDLFTMANKSLPQQRTNSKSSKTLEAKEKDDEGEQGAVFVTDVRTQGGTHLGELHSRNTRRCSNDKSAEGGGRRHMRSTATEGSTPGGMGTMMSDQPTVATVPEDSAVEQVADQGEDDGKDAIQTDLSRSILGGFAGGNAAVVDSDEDVNVDLPAQAPTGVHAQNPAAFKKLNELIHKRSKRAQLVVMNLPDLWGTEPDEVTKYMDYCDTLTQGLERVLFVHSSGHEIFDISPI